MIRNSDTSPREFLKMMVEEIGVRGRLVTQSSGQPTDRLPGMPGLNLSLRGDAIVGDVTLEHGFRLHFGLEDIAVLRGHLPETLSTIEGQPVGEWIGGAIMGDERYAIVSVRRIVSPAETWLIYRSPRVGLISGLPR